MLFIQCLTSFDCHFLLVDSCHVWLLYETWNPEIISQLWWIFLASLHNWNIFRRTLVIVLEYDCIVFQNSHGFLPSVWKPLTPTGFLRYYLLSCEISRLMPSTEEWQDAFFNTICCLTGAMNIHGITQWQDWLLEQGRYQLLFWWSLFNVYL